MKSASWVNLLVGIWLLISPAALTLARPLVSNNVAFGILAIIVAVWSLVVVAENHAPAWINFAFGIWVIIAPWALGAREMAGVWSNLISGALLIIFALVRVARHRLPARPVA